VVPGKCDKSFGIHVAEITKFPIEVLDMAKKKVKELENTLEVSAEEEQKMTKIMSLFSSIEGMDKLSDQDIINSLQDNISNLF
jgi:DNA mismatch repair ATPase MutS